MKQIKKMVETTIYVADDGTEFDDEWDCVCYEEQELFDSIHMLGEKGERVDNYYEAWIFSINSISQITKLKDYSRKQEISMSELENVTEKGVYVWNDSKKAFYKYPKNF